MKIVFNIILLTAVSILLNGCFAGSNDNVNYFSINYPQINLHDSNPLKKDYKITVLPFSSNELYRKRMVFSKPPNDIFFDTSNCWAQNPTAMLTNYFSLYLGSNIDSKGTNIKSYTLTGKILEFDGDLGTETAKLTIQLELNDNAGNTVLNNTYSNQQKMEKLSASAFAQSMTESTNAVASEFLKEISKIN